MSKPHLSAKFPRRFLAGVLFLAGLVLASVPLGRARGQSQPTNQQNQQSQQPAAQPQQPEQSTPEAGGPSGDNGVIALPKKKESTEEPPAPAAPPEPKFKNPDNFPTTSLRVEVPEVTVDVGVLLEKTHQFVPGLKPDNFRVYEDGVLQHVEGFRRTEAPITVLLLCEYASRGFWFRVQMLNAAWAFTQQLRPQDYVSMMTFDLNTHIVSDFTQDKQQIVEGHQRAGQRSVDARGISGDRRLRCAERVARPALAHPRAEVHSPDRYRHRFHVEAYARPDPQAGEGIARYHASLPSPPTDFLRR